MILLICLSSCAVSLCAGMWLRGVLDQRDWRKWERELEQPELEHYRRTF